MGKELCVACEYLDSCIFRGLAEDKRVQLYAVLQHRVFAKSELIFQQGAAISGCHILCRGKVKLARRTPQGKRQLIQFPRPGDLFGESAFLGKKESAVYAQALEKSVIGWVSQGDFLELLQRYPGVSLEVNRKFARTLEQLRIRLTERAYEGACDRLIGLLVELSTEYGCRTDQGLRIDLELTEVEIAEMLGNTREWVCKQMATVQRRRLIAYRRGKIVILDEAGLWQLITSP